MASLGTPICTRSRPLCYHRGCTRREYEHIPVGPKLIPVAGKRDDPALGHVGAGVFWDDVWLEARHPNDSTVEKAPRRQH